MLDNTPTPLFRSRRVQMRGPATFAVTGKPGHWTLRGNGLPIFAGTHEDLARLFGALEDALPDIDAAEYDAAEAERLDERAHERSVSAYMGLGG